MACGIHDDGIADDIHGPKLITLINRLGVVGKVERLDAFRYTLFQVEHSSAEHLDSESGVSRCPLFLKFSENTCGVGIFPLLRKCGENPVAVAPPFPERYDDVAVSLTRLLI